MLLLVPSVAVDAFNFESSCRDVLPEKIIVEQLVKKFPLLMDPEISLPCLRELARVSNLSCANTV